MRLTKIEKGKWYEMKSGAVGLCLQVGGTFPVSVKFDVPPWGVRFYTPREVVREVPDPTGGDKK